MRNSDNGLELKLNLFKISQKVKFLSSKVISLSSKPKPPQFNTPLSFTPKTNHFNTPLSSTHPSVQHRKPLSSTPKTPQLKTENISVQHKKLTKNYISELRC